MSNTNVSKLEALLFYHGEPIELKKIAQTLGVSVGECEKLIAALADKLESDDASAFKIIRQGEKIQLVTKPAFEEIGAKLLSDEFKESLTPAALETLSIVAYLGPVPRSTVDYIRGVNSTFILRNLLMRGLIERSKTDGRRYAYEITFDFLRHMGLEKKEDLPEYEKYSSILNKLMSDTEERKN